MVTQDSFQWPYLISGLIVGLFGWLLYWAGIPIMGGIVGAASGGFLGLVGADALHLANPVIYAGIGVLLGAILGVLLMRAIQVYFFFTAGAALGGALAWHLLRVYHPATASTSPDLQSTIIIAISALAGGFLIVYFRRFLVALSTSALGVVLVQYGLPPQYQLLGVLVSMVVFVSVQIGLVRRFVEKEEFDHRMRRYRQQGREEA